jgi:hypothetical protein
MHRFRAPSFAPGTFFVAQPWADCITNVLGFNLRQARRLRRFFCFGGDAILALAAMVIKRRRVGSTGIAVLFSEST